MDIPVFIPTKLEEHATCQHRVHDTLQTEIILSRHQHSVIIFVVTHNARRFPYSSCRTKGSGVEYIKNIVLGVPVKSGELPCWQQLDL